MGALIVSGFERDWCEFAQQRLSEMGVSDIQQQTQIGMTPSTFLERVERRFQSISNDGSSRDSASLGKAWDLAAAAIFIGNSDQENWMWSDPRHVRLLEFWASFDPDCKFVLLYNSFVRGFPGPQKVGADSLQLQESEQLAWSKYHDSILRFYFSYPERSVLAHVDHFNGSGKHMVDLLSSKLSVPTRRLNASKFMEKSVIESVLLEQHSETPQEILELYSELENAADLSLANIDNPNAAKLDRAIKELEDFQSAVESLQDVEAQNEDLNERLKEVSSQLLAEEELRLRFQQELHESEKIRAEIEYRCKNLQVTIDRLEAELDTLESAQSSGIGGDLAEDNQLLALQLEQAREELERYFEKYQEAVHQLEESREDSFESDSNSLGVESGDRPNGQAIEPFLCIDMRHFVEGSGWHSPESHGRWAGAEETSTVVLPKLMVQNYSIKLRIVDTMTVEHLKGMIVSVNGHVLPTKLKIFSDIGGRLAPLRRLRAKAQKAVKPVPAELSAYLSREILRDDSPGCVLTISTKKPLSPSAQGQADPRTLSVCVESIEIEGCA